MKAQETGKKTIAVKAVDIMSAPVVALYDEDTMRHAAGILLDRGISGAPVLDGGRRPVGVLTKTDIVRYERERAVRSPDDDFRRLMRTADTLEVVSNGGVFHIVSKDDCVRRWMTPRVHSLPGETGVREVARLAARLKVHRVFIFGRSGEIAGVITTFDLMKHFAGVSRTDYRRGRP